MRRPIHVVGTDLSTASRKAMTAAADLARRTGARLDVVCAVPPHAVAADPEFTARVASALDALAKRADCGDAERTVMIAQDAATALSARARTTGADLVVVAPRGAAGGRRMWLGSVTERLLRLAPAMLLIVRNHLPAAGGRVLVAVDMTPGSTRALRVALDVARALRAKLTVLHVIPSPGATLTPVADIRAHAVWSWEETQIAETRREFLRWVRRFRSDGVRVDPLVAFGHPADAVRRAAADSGATLVVVGSHGKTAVHEAFVGSVAHAVASYSPVSVLVVRAKPALRVRRAR